MQISAVRDQLESIRTAIRLFFARRAGPQEAQDLEQELWARVLARPPDDHLRFRSYAFTIAWRLLVDRARARARAARTAAWLHPLEPVAPGPEGHVAAGEAARLIEQVLSELPASTAQVFRWRVLQDVPFKEIARRQGVPIGTALGRMHTATRRIAAALAEAGCLPPEEGGEP